jgi:hypothetical protein
MVTDQTSGGDHRSVAAENGDQIDITCKLFTRDLDDRAASCMLDAFSFNFWPTHQFNAALSEPTRQLADSLQSFRMMGLQNYPDPLNLRHAD